MHTYSLCIQNLFNFFPLKTWPFFNVKLFKKILKYTFQNNKIIILNVLYSKVQTRLFRGLNHIRLQVFSLLFTTIHYWGSPSTRKSTIDTFLSFTLDFTVSSPASFSVQFYHIFSAVIIRPRSSGPEINDDREHNMFHFDVEVISADCMQRRSEKDYYTIGLHSFFTITVHLYDVRST